MRSLIDDLLQNTEKAIIEEAKYGSKIFTGPDLKKSKSGNHKIYAKALHNILQAMNGERIFERFGFNLPNYEYQTDTSTKRVSEYETWTFESARANWVNDQTKEALATYSAPFELREILAFNIDLVSS